MHMSSQNGHRLHCACCARPFARTSRRGPAPLYCSADCRTQMRIRKRVWSGTPALRHAAVSNDAGPAFPMARAS